MKTIRQKAYPRQRVIFEVVRKNEVYQIQQTAEEYKLIKKGMVTQ